MCMLCIEIAKGHITYKEAKRNIQELVDLMKLPTEAAHLGKIFHDLLQIEEEAIKNGGTENDKTPRAKWI